MGPFVPRLMSSVSSRGPRFPAEPDPTQADAVAAQGAAQVESCLAAAMLLLPHLRATWRVTEGGVAGHAVLGGTGVADHTLLWGLCGKKTHSAPDPPHPSGTCCAPQTGETLPKCTPQKGRNDK